MPYLDLPGGRTYHEVAGVGEPLLVLQGGFSSLEVMRDVSDREMPSGLRAAAEAAKGFMPAAAGQALYETALAYGARGPILEVGTYCGKSAIYLGAAAHTAGSVVVTVDHHHGSEENQAGWEWHDASLVDPSTGRMDTLPTFRRTIVAAGLEEQEKRDESAGAHAAHRTHS